jgi:DNA-directed RNA polymerase beta' subunit
MEAEKELITKRVNKIVLNIWTPKEIHDYSVCEITSTDCFDNNDYPVFCGLFDLRMGTINKQYRCITCKHNVIKCPGHFGRITLAKKVYYPHFIPYIIKILQIVCFKCKKFLDSTLNSHEVWDHKRIYNVNDHVEFEGMVYRFCPKKTRIGTKKNKDADEIESEVKIKKERKKRVEKKEKKEKKETIEKPAKKSKSKNDDNDNDDEELDEEIPDDFDEEADGEGDEDFDEIDNENAEADAEDDADAEIDAEADADEDAEVGAENDADADPEADVLDEDEVENDDVINELAENVDSDIVENDINDINIIKPNVMAKAEDINSDDTPNNNPLWKYVGKCKMSASNLATMKNIGKNPNLRFRAIHKRCKRKKCLECGEEQPKIKRDSLKLVLSYDGSKAKKVFYAEDCLEHLLSISNESYHAMGLNPEKISGLICSILPICPPSTRPSVWNGYQRSEGDITHNLLEIVKANEQLKSNMVEMDREIYNLKEQLNELSKKHGNDGNDEDNKHGNGNGKENEKEDNIDNIDNVPIIESNTKSKSKKPKLTKKKISEEIQKLMMIQNDYYELLQYYIFTLIDNKMSNIPSAQQRSGRPLTSIRQRLEGKGGRFRSNCMGKRADFTARTVVDGDPLIDVDEVGVPYMIAKQLTSNEIVSERNDRALRKCVTNGADVHPGANYVILNSKNGMRINLKYNNNLKFSYEITKEYLEQEFVKELFLEKREEESKQYDEWLEEKKLDDIKKAELMAINAAIQLENSLNSNSNSKKTKKRELVNINENVNTNFNTNVNTNIINEKKQKSEKSEKSDKKTKTDKKFIIEEQPIAPLAAVVFPEFIKKWLRWETYDEYQKNATKKELLNFKEEAQSLPKDYLEKRRNEFIIQYGDVVERHLQTRSQEEGPDYVCFNRQPSLHKMNMMGHRVRVLPYLSFRLNPSVCSNYNADFDGKDSSHCHQQMSAKIVALQTILGKTL